MKIEQRLTTLDKNVGTLGRLPPPPDSSITTLKNFPKLCFFIKTMQRGEGTAQCIPKQSEVSHVFLTGVAARKVRPRTITSGFCVPCFKVRIVKQYQKILTQFVLSRNVSLGCMGENVASPYML